MCMNIKTLKKINKKVKLLMNMSNFQKIISNLKIKNKMMIKNKFNLLIRIKSLFKT